MARKSKAASAATDELEFTPVQLESELYVHPEFIEVTPEEVKVDEKLYLKTFEGGIHVEYVLKGSLEHVNGGGCVKMTIKLSHMEEEIPFAANPNDVHDYGVWLYEQAMAGKLGKIKAYERPLPTAHDLQLELDALMTDITLGLATEEELDLARNLRKQIKVMTA